jgi:hypothetical protein
MRIAADGLADGAAHTRDQQEHEKLNQHLRPSMGW